jgi:hypothetical protein
LSIVSISRSRASGDGFIESERAENRWQKNKRNPSGLLIFLPPILLPLNQNGRRTQGKKIEGKKMKATDTAFLFFCP